MIEDVAALLFGTSIGVFVQWVAFTLKYNGEWETISRRRKIASAITGGIAAFIAGLTTLSTVSPNTIDPRLFYKMWLAQTIAAWGGAVFLERVTSRGSGKKE